jgi:hypothetical protein
MTMAKWALSSVLLKGKNEARRAHVRDESSAGHGKDAERRPMAAACHQ